MNTTIAVSVETKNLLKEFGSKGETYDDIIRRLHESASKRIFQDFLYDESNSIPLKEALERAKNRWSE